MSKSAMTRSAARLADWIDCLVRVRIRRDAEGATEEFAGAYEAAIPLGRSYFLIFRDAEESRRMVSADTILEMCDLPDPGIKEEEKLS